MIRDFLKSRVCDKVASSSLFRLFTTSSDLGFDYNLGGSGFKPIISPIENHGRLLMVSTTVTLIKNTEDFHRKYYQPSNARIWFHGNDEYLDMFDESPTRLESKFETRKLFLKPVRVDEKYPAAEGGDLKRKHMVCLNWLLSDEPLDLETELAIRLLNHLLLAMPASPIRKILLESSLGDAIVGGGMEDELLQPQFRIGRNGVSEENIQ